MIVRWSLDELPATLAELGVDRPLLVASERWTSLDVPRADHWSEVPSDRIEVPPGVDSILAVGGGSAIDTAQYASSTTGLPVISVPTTYSGAEWTPTFGIRSPDRRIQGAGGGAHLAAIVYDVELTVDLPRAVTVGTSMNALALPPALQFNAKLAPEAVARFGAAIGAPDDPAARVEELARLGGFERLRDFGVPEDDLPAVAEAASRRTGNQNNPRPATPAEIEQLLREIY